MNPLPPNIKLTHWWKKHSKEKRAGLDPDSFKASAIYCATCRRLLLNGISGPRQHFTELVEPLLGRTWVDLQDREKEEIKRSIFCDPPYRGPIGYSIFPETEKWQDAATVHSLDRDVLEVADDPIKALDFCRRIRAYLSEGRHLVDVDASSAQAVACAAMALKRTLPRTIKQSDWAVECDAPVDLDELKKWACEQAAIEGESERKISFTVTVKAQGKQEKRNTLYPVHQFNSWEIFAEFENFDRTGLPGSLIKAIRL